MDTEFAGILMINSFVLQRYQGDGGLREKLSRRRRVASLSLSPPCRCACALYATKNQEDGEPLSLAGNIWIIGGRIESIQEMQVSEGVQAGAGA